MFIDQTKEPVLQQGVSKVVNDNAVSIQKEKPQRVQLNSTVSFATSRTNNQRDMLQKHSNSCSTIYVDDSTVSQPNWKAMIKCVSIAIHSHIVHRKSNKTMSIFDEKLHPLTVR